MDQIIGRFIPGPARDDAAERIDNFDQPPAADEGDNEVEFAGWHWSTHCGISVQKVLCFYHLEGVFIFVQAKLPYGI